MRSKSTPSDLLWRKVVRCGSAPDACWERISASHPFGYTYVRVGGRQGKSWLAHRLAWTVTCGPIPEGMVVCHNCPGGDNPSCVRPDHLFLGSLADNNRDMARKGRHWSRPRPAPRVHGEHTPLRPTVPRAIPAHWPWLVCVHCGRSFQRRPTAARQTVSPRCSRACSLATGYRRRLPLSERPSRPTQWVTLACEQCGRSFRRSPAQIANGASRHCSRRCQSAHSLKEGPADRLWPKVDASGEHWLFTGCLDKKGYGRLGMRRQNGYLPVQVHILAWELAGGPIPEGLCVLHTCDIPNCVRNDDEGVYELDGVLHPRRGHLWLGTVADNNRDMALKGRVNRIPVPTERRIRGEAHGRSKLKAAEVLEIRRLTAIGMPDREIARQFSVTPGTIGTIRRGQKWKHLL